MKNHPQILVLGSLAFDFIMKFPSRFTDSLINIKDGIDVTFTSRKMFVHRGGTGGNISYNLDLLKADGILISTAGRDFHSHSYKEGLQNFTIDFRIEFHQNYHTAAAFIITDIEDNQITLFNEGASLKSEDLDIKAKIRPEDNIQIAINAPNPVPSMIKYAHALNELDIPMVFDPGQKINLFTKSQLRQIIPLTSHLIVNQSEFNHLKRTLKTDLNTLSKDISSIIITLGDKGLKLYHKGEKNRIPVTPPDKVIDPTGAGDAFRAGFLKGLVERCSLKDACQLGAVMGSFCVEQFGAQGHQCSIIEIRDRYELTYGHAPKFLI
jgi:adenosine kinase